ncbi:NADH-quinone oxidoreductase subunit N [Desulfurispirillum indicum]|uniref:NADH-quinone oxidoreductase subunit N n=1 Tax=Desulfurispirillum indicum (strain ATCC BAA-1389 / DSM 22839 / S5) TaxID=653733 RepID=E6W2N4_DESIS|nr:NADH-quinone oxidoreductase subunit N [Desulfurispirillum indicum]ADU65618.1 proton-translocating NADH-quinone oxidoreductase, chain N [Desulfurispirillum indicum S5]UCZ57547.1 NADH-quinone oxidoreductase subunit N [Desulfurispirillum indicum]
MITDNIQLMLPGIIVGLGATVMMIFGASNKLGVRGSSALSIAIMAVAGVIQLLQMGTVYSYGTMGGLFNGMLIGDTFSGFIILLALACGIMTTLTCSSYFEENQFHRVEFDALLLFSVFGIIIMAMAGELITMFIALEIMSMSIYVMVGFNRNSLRASEATLKYIVLGAFAGAFFVMGTAFIYGATGSTILSHISVALEEGAVHTPVFIGGLTMLLIAIFFKIAAFPFHAWSPDVYDGAPYPVTGFMATAVKAATFAIVLRMFMTNFMAIEEVWTPIMFWAAIFTMFAGNFLAIAQNNVKRMVAASGIVHTGYLLIGMTALGASAAAAPAIMFYLVSYAVSTLGLFAALSYVAGKGEKRINFSDFNGMARKHPFIAAVISLFMLSFVGLPPLIGFIGKFYLFTSAVEAGFVSLAVIGIINSIISLYYYLRIIIAMYFRTAEDEFEVQVPVYAKVGAGIAALAAIWGGIGGMTLVIFPGAESLLEAARLSIQSLLL